MEHRRQTGKSIHVLVAGQDVTNRTTLVDGDTVTLLCGDKESHRDWRIDGPVHFMPDADDRPCEIKVRGEVETVELDA
jgi:hypothetical protein